MEDATSAAVLRDMEEAKKRRFGTVPIFPVKEEEAVDPVEEIMRMIDADVTVTALRDGEREAEEIPKEPAGDQRDAQKELSTLALAGMQDETAPEELEPDEESEVDLLGNFAYTMAVGGTT